MKFWKVFLASLLGVLAAGIISSLFWISTLMGLVGSFGMESVVEVEEESILVIDFRENITDSPAYDPMAGFDLMSMTMSENIVLFDVLQAIEVAKSDERIKGIYINPKGVGAMGNSAVEEIRAALEGFKAGGKFIVSYGETFSQGVFYLASVADKIYLQKEGGLSFQGLSMTMPFYKGLFDKIGVEYEIFRPTVCRYKSAVEPYFLKKMSPENREQNQLYIDTAWGVIAGAIADSRGLDVKEFNRLVDNLDLTLPEDALKYGLVDGLIYEDEMENYFEEQGVERNEEDEFNFISLGEYVSQLTPNLEHLTDPKISILYAQGQIMDGEGTDGSTIYGTTLAQQVRDLRKDDDVKAVVVRVNSPGGSALASDVVWREMELLQAEKPVIVSMGDAAASGGYYISTPADAILANKLTITGSIGVFGAFPVVGELLEDKVGLTFDTVKTNENGEFGQGFLVGTIYPTTPRQREMLIRSVDKVYESFTSKVAEGRNLPLERVLEIAQGRIWNGVNALEIGLVDGNGGLMDAIALAAEKAGLQEYQVVEYEPELEGISAFLSQLNMRLKAHYELDALGVAYAPYKQMCDMLQQRGVLMYSPYLYSIE